MRDTARAQVKPLAVGDTLPELPFHQVINYPRDSVMLSDFKGRLLILDFWNTWCTACLASFPKLHRLQQQFPEKVMILPVVSYRGGSRKKYSEFYKMRSEMGMPIALPSIVEDSILVQLFPHRALPHVVWIDTAGKVLGITGGGELKEENIKRLVSGDSNGAKHSPFEKKREGTAYDEAKPFLLYGNGGEQDSFEERSVLAKNVAFRKGGNLKIFRDSIRTRISVMNMTVPNLFTAVFARRYPEKFRRLTGSYLSKGIINESSAAELYRSLRPAAGSDLNSMEKPDYYSYELIRSGDVPEEIILDEMIIDLNRLFRVNARLEERRIPVLELYVSDASGITETKYPKQPSSFDVVAEGDKSRFVFSNQHIATVVSLLNQRLDLPFIVDSTGIDKRLDMQFLLDAAGRSGRELSVALAKYGLALREGQISFEVLVIGDR